MPFTTSVYPQKIPFFSRIWSENYNVSMPPPA
ncbi:hypothetical protein AG1IA_06763 [Rhizoctonia solani AG-1 IA]|uniref:Uncharacterized protein n=1 Tax=Thanatephorus cucumeris (strain AG1-IA) TaxID=983506 RepID=L8WQZ3_THACA|nr:hypothetical protein AG1IA_06763 [Rhizoctonia solani AG-1 IA]